MLKEDFLNKTKYNIIHKESPDNRGIDCALSKIGCYKKIFEYNIKKNEILIMGDFNDYPSDNSILNVQNLKIASCII